MNGKAALEESFSIILFDSPGQGEALREQRLYFMSGWETLVTAIVDFALDQSIVTANRVLLLGISMGGCLVGIALCFEHRNRAAVVNDGVYEFGAAFHAQNPAFGRSLLCGGSDATITALMFQMLRRDMDFKWGFRRNMGFQRQVSSRGPTLCERAQTKGACRHYPNASLSFGCAWRSFPERTAKSLG